MNTKKILEQLGTIEKNISEKRIKKINLPLTKRVIKRLDEFSEACNACQGRLNDFSIIIEKIIQGNDQRIDKELETLINDTTTHLEKVHNLVPENHYTNTYMAYGVAFGLVFGGGFSQLINQNAFIASGLPIGIGLGLAIGSKLDEDAKKEGLQI